MFTFRAERHSSVMQPTEYAVYEADTYDVLNQEFTLPQKDRGKKIILRRGKFPIYEDSSLIIEVGAKFQFNCVFVMNEFGRTVDRILSE